MDDKFKNLSFKDFVTVDYAQLDDELAAYRRKRLKNGAMHEWVEEQEKLDEDLSISQRLKKSKDMKKRARTGAFKAQRARALKKPPTRAQLFKRAKKKARNDMIKKWTRGAEKGEQSFARRAEFEKKLKKMDAKLNARAKKAMPELQKFDRERRKAMAMRKNK